MRKPLVKIALVAAVSGSLMFTACKENDGAQPQETAVEDNNSGLDQSEDLVSVSEDILDSPALAGSLRIAEEKGTFQGLNGATITITPKGENATGMVVIDFGQGVTYRNKTRKGKVIITYTDRRRVSGAVRTVTFENYHVNDHKVDGTKKITFGNAVTPESAIFSARIESAIKITTKEGKVAQWTSDRTRAYDTKGTLKPEDDEMSLTGQASGINRNGMAYTAVITTPLLIKHSCLGTSGAFPSSGVLEITPAGLAKRTVSYGSGTCDRTATVTVDGRTFEVTAR